MLFQCVCLLCTCMQVSVGVSMYLCFCVVVCVTVCLYPCLLVFLCVCVCVYLYLCVSMYLSVCQAVPRPSRASPPAPGLRRWPAAVSWAGKPQASTGPKSAPATTAPQSLPPQRDHPRTHTSLNTQSSPVNGRLRLVIHLVRGFSEGLVLVRGGFDKEQFAIVVGIFSPCAACCAAWTTSEEWGRFDFPFVPN